MTVGDAEPVRLKVLSARVAEDSSALALAGDAILVPCADGSTLALLKVQPPSRNPVPAAAFWNGLRGKTLALAQ